LGLLEHKNQFSQNGEDGILHRVFELMSTETRCCCEFGAWDGIHFSKTRRLLLKGWSGLLIGPDADRFRTPCSNYAGVSRKVKDIPC
jgi:hypothetical protein